MANQGIKKVFVTPLDVIATTDLEGLGVIRWEGNKAYKWILYENGAAAVAGVLGEVCGYYAASGTATSGYDDNVVTSDYSDTTDVAAGVLQASLTDGTYGWIQIKGSYTLSIGLTAGADGDALTTVGAGDGTLDLNIVTAASTHICAYAFDASADIIVCDFPF